MSKQQDQITEAAKAKISEQILGVAFAKPRGATTAVVGGGFIGREIGLRTAGKQGKGAAAAGIEIGNPGAVAVTPTSFVTMKLKVSFTGQIKEVTDVLSTVPLAEVDLEVKRMGMAGVMEVTAGGSSFKLEGKAGDMKDFADAFQRAKTSA